MCGTSTRLREHNLHAKPESALSTPIVGILGFIISPSGIFYGPF